MACIMCSGRLLRELGNAGRAYSVAMPEHFMPGVVLGSWAAKLFTEQKRKLVLALDTRTYLTLVFEFAEGPRFRSNFASALANALHGNGVPPAVVRMESAAVEVAPFAALRNRELTNALKNIEFFCGIEFAYHDELHLVQRNLNDIPHPNRDPCVPKEALKRLFRNEPIRPCIAH